MPSRAFKNLAKLLNTSCSNLYKVRKHTHLQLGMQGIPMNGASLNSYKLCALSMLNSLATKELR